MQDIKQLKKNKKEKAQDIEDKWIGVKKSSAMTRMPVDLPTDIYNKFKVKIVRERKKIAHVIRDLVNDYLKA